MGTLRTRRAIMHCWTEVSPSRRTGLVGVTLGSLFLLFLALRHVRLHPDALVYLPAYLVFIYLFHQSWSLFLCTGARERFFVALGFSLSVLRYLLLFTPLEPYLDILTVLTFYSFAYSQALVFEESPRAFRFLKIVGFLSLAFYLAMVLDYWAWRALGPRPFLFDRLQLETGIGPVWLLSSLGLLIGFLLYVHLRAALETDDFPIRLRLWFLVLSWLFFAAFFLRDEGVHFGWFVPNRKIYDLLLVLSIIFTQLGLAMPRPVERFLTSLYFLDRQTSREITLFVLTWLAKHSTGSALTELAMAVAERLGFDPRVRQQIFLACEFLAVEYPLPTLPFSSGETTDWEDLAVSAVAESRRLAAHQQTVFKAWAIKRAVEQGTFWQTPRHPARLIAACRDSLLGVGPGPYEPELWQTVEKTAAELLALPQGRVPPPAGEGPALPSDLKRVSMRTAEKKGPKVYSSGPFPDPKKRR